MKIDPYKHKERYQKWKEHSKEGIQSISKVNSDLLLRYLADMEHGLNVSITSTKGARSFIRLNTIKEKGLFFITKFRELYDLEDKRDVVPIFLFFNQKQKNIE